MKNKKFRKGMFSAVAVVLVIAIAIAANVFITSKNYTFDVTSNQIYTISDQTKSILKDLDQKVKVYVINNENDVNASYAQIFSEYKKNSKNVTFIYKDPDLYPNFTAKYVDDTSDIQNDSIVVVCGEKSRYISSSDFVNYSYGSDGSYSADSLELESLLTEAINYVTSEKTPVIYTLSGHSEQSLSSGMTSSFEGDNYSIETLSLLTEDQVPDDCEILLINGPTKDISKAELKKLKKYMKNGGKMYVFLNASAGDDMTNLYALLKAYNLEVEKGIVVEGDSMHYTQYPNYLIPNIESSDVTSAQYDSNVYILAPSAKGIKEITTEDADSAYTVTPLLTTSDSAYSKVDTSSSNVEKEKGDIDGPFDIAAAVSDENGGRLIVTGCCNMLVDEIDAAVSGSNTDFVLNGINYLTKQESKISIRSKSLTSSTVIVPAFAQKTCLILVVFVIPVLILFVGIVIVLRRRKL